MASDKKKIESVPKDLKSFVDKRTKPIELKPIKAPAPKKSK
jgi:hypothetical protein